MIQHEGRNDFSEKEPATVRILRGASFLEYSHRAVNMENSLLGNRWLCRGGGAFIVAPSGHGKSVLATQGSIELACARVAFGIPGTRALRSLVVQSEDDDDDIIEFSRMIDYLKLTEAERQLVGLNTHCEFVNDAVGSKFLTVLDGFLEQRPVDLVWINPYSAYLGADIRDDEANTLFLRAGLNRILSAHRCSAVVVAHTPKLNFRADTSEWRPSEWMYAAAGAATITNWARAVLVVDPTPTPGVYRFIAAKRYQRIGWQGFEQFWAHSTEPGKILWVPATDEQIATGKKSRDAIPADLLPLVPVLDPVTKDEIIQAAKERLHIGRDTVRTFLKVLVGQGKVFAHRVRRPRTNPETRYAQTAQTED
jgi:AAA domain